MTHRLPWLCCALYCGAMLYLRAAEEPVSFNLQVRPILSDRCWACHGPDENKRKAKLRLDTKEAALASQNDKFIIKPGDPNNSEFFKRLISTDPDEKMPPPDSHLSVSAAEISTLKRWIEEGANWEKHWAYVPPRKTSPPNVKEGWANNDLDRFIFARLEKEGLEPAQEASKERLIRRVAFDLTGLPPTIEEIDAFLADASTNAYEKVVDRLLASEAYGERMAIDWLDLARYSDTHGYQADRYRAMWPWRDWVIKAFNENMPYEQFVTWQLAGDLLPNPTKEQLLATAFNRHHMQTEEGGSVEEEFRVSYVVDRVNTMGTAFLAQTFECSRCHDHKYDPISQKDFYSLYSFFNNIDESGQTSHFTDSMPVPTLLLSDAATDKKLAELKRSIREKEIKAEALKKNARGAFLAWLKEKPGAQPIKGIVAEVSFDELKDKKFANAANGNKPAHAVEGPEVVDGRAGKALALNGENGVTLNDLGVFSRIDPFSASLWIRTPTLPKRAVLFHRSMAALDAGSRGYEVVLEEGKVAVGLHHMWPGNALKVVGKTEVPTNEWVQLTMIYDGSSRAEGVRLYQNGAEIELNVIRDNLWKDIAYERGNPQLAIGYRFRDNGFRDGQVDEFKLYDRALTALEVKHLYDGNSLSDALATANENEAALLDYYVANHNPIFQQHLRDLRDLRTQQSKLINPIPEVMVMHEMATPRPAFVLKRGAYDAPADPVTFDTPEAILPFASNYPRSRLGLAQWLFAHDNPLTARVAVNRLWQMIFGRGLVATADNFGSQGELPSHPDLLDWLANDFRRDWNVKRLVKQMAMSATYRQSSKGSEDALRMDPENRLLARGPAHRLTAEMIRDNALAASGLLVKKVGGAPVKPYQPEGLWEEKSGAKYERDKGEGLYRRSVYTFWKRTSPPPAMIAFDSAERNVCIVTRQATSTPLQALVLLNDPQLAEAARHLAERALKNGGSTTQSRLSYMFRLVTSRNPKSAELDVLTKMFEEQHALLSRNEQETAKFLTVGDKANDPAIPPVELASAAIVANALFNFDEVVMKR